MNLIPLLAQGFDLKSGGIIVGASVLIFIVLFILIVVVLSRYTKVGPNQVLVEAILPDGARTRPEVVQITRLGDFRSGDLWVLAVGVQFP